MLEEEKKEELLALLTGKKVPGAEKPAGRDE